VVLRVLVFGDKLAQDGSVVLFPYEPGVLSCGITGILAFKKAPAQTRDLPVQALERKVENLSEHTWKGLEEKGLWQEEHYLGGVGFLRAIKHLGEQLKGQTVFYDLFSNRHHQERLSTLCTKLEALIEAEDKVLSQKKGYLAAKASEVTACRMTELRDILWSLKHEVLENIEKIALLGRFGQYENNPRAVKRFKEMNLIFNNLDRLEVRGRDSAGISFLFVLDETAFSDFQKRLKEASLLDEFETRQAGQVLVNRDIRTHRRETGVSLVFTYKVAAEVGSLGDNVQYLRQQVRDDAIFQHLVRFPHMDHSAVAHTRWASVGEISEANCHPVDNDPGGSRWIVHVCLNGDIDNYQGLRRDFERETGRFISDEVTTDTKIIPLQIEKYLEANKTLEEAFRLAVNDFEGSHAIAMHSDLAPGKLFLAQRGSGQAIFVGLADDHYVPASEIYGFVEETSRFLKMEGERAMEGISGQTQGQIFVLDSNSEGGLDGIKAISYDGTPVTFCEEDIKETEITSRDIDRQQFPHYFLKEVSESPRSVEQTIEGRVAIIEKNGKAYPQILLDHSVIPARLESALRENKLRRVFFIGQGTAGVAASGCTALLRDYLSAASILVASFKASEFSGFMLDDTLEDALVVAITQSGTTTDTNRAIDMARGQGAFTLAIVNRRDSDITFKVDGVLYTSSGRDIEMAVASTKAYYSQIVAGGILGLKLAQLTGRGQTILFGRR